MITLSKHVAIACLSTLMLASCARQQAYFQPTARESFKATKAVTVAQATPVQTPVVESVTIVETMPAPAEVPVVTPAPEVVQAKKAVDQLDAYVRNDSKLASSKKLTKRMARLNELMTTATDKATLSTKAASAQKMSFMERTVLKKMDKKIKNHVSPEKTQAMNSNVRLGLIVGIIGLLLLILGGGSVLGVIGLIGFIVGLVLVLLGVING